MRASARRSRAIAAGFTLVEVLVALMIVATTVAALQTVSNATLKSAVETNRIRIAKMLLRYKAEEIVAGVEQGSGGTFDGFPGYEWSVTEQEVPVTDASASGGTGGSQESVRSVEVSVTMPSFGTTTTDPGDARSADGPGRMSLATLLDPPDAKLQPPK